MKKQLAVIALVLLVGAGSVQAQFSGLTKTGLAAATFLTIDVGARSKAMGGAFVGMADDMSAMYWNPAGIAKMKTNGLLLSHTRWIADVNFDYAGLGIPLGNFGTLGAFFTAVTMPEMKVRTVAQPEGTGELFGASDIALGLTYARFITDRFTIGASFKYIRESIFNSAASTIAADFGTQFRTGFNNMILAFSISNFGGDMRLSGIDTRVEVDISPNEFGNNDRIFANLATEKFQLPLVFRVGVAMDVINRGNNRATVALDAVVPNNNQQFLNVGGEYWLHNFIALRAGYRSLGMKDSQEGVTFGAGIKQKLFGQGGLQLDYAYSDFGLLNNVQEFSLSIFF